jgi:hypothetical protein
MQRQRSLRGATCNGNGRCAGKGNGSARMEPLSGRRLFSVNQFIASAAAEKMASIMTLDYLSLEASKGNRSDFTHYLSMVPDAPAQEGDERP